MEFSDAVEVSCAAKLSPGGDHVASLEEGTLVVRCSETGEALQEFSLDGSFRDILWSPSGEHIACVSSSRSITEVRSLSDVDWTCTIREGCNKISEMVWGPQSTQLISISRMGLRATVWSLTSATAICDVECPKNGSAGLCFREDGLLAAIATREGGRDVVHIRDTYSWKHVSSFIPSCKDLAGLSWSPDGHCIAVWDSHLDYMLVLCTPNGITLNHFTAYANAMGARTVRWSPGGEMIAVGSCDSTVRVLCTTTWRLLAEFEDSTPPSDAVSFQEKFIETEDGEVRVGYEASGEMETIPAIEDGDYVNRKERDQIGGVGRIEWSRSGFLLASIDSAHPHVVRIWDMQKGALSAVIVQRSPITDIQWDFSKDRLGICTANSYFYAWTPDGSSCIRLPFGDFNCRNLQFASNGECMLLNSKSDFSLAYDTSIGTVP